MRRGLAELQRAEIGRAQTAIAASYTGHGAALRTPGACVYITGFTPFRKVITIKPG